MNIMENSALAFPLFSLFSSSHLLLPSSPLLPPV
ncbi:hypothetical protein CJF31_00004840 [Rutstroemia sp. NJR-2017a BVV2]|nr:hypothetical protein CJF31_00004840 [Rutstroemia sp. NJR-2017a BVV2]